MAGIKNLIVALLILIPASAVPRFIYCLHKYTTDDEQSSLYKRRLINLLVFVAIAECIVSLLYVVYNYVH